MESDAALMERSLVATAPREPAMRAALFERFLARYPDHRALFMHVEATSQRMTSEALGWMLGLAQDESWVWSQIAELVFQHRNYGHFPAQEYADFVDMAIDALGEAAGDDWDAPADAAWRRQAQALNTLIARAISEWTASPLPFP
ncbi:globin domain-containing protein [uncultured Sphingomonas sp.]|uniref:globin domain-containing protein n=1 Tax=uncultured Sphingomonas sp. TaxID=158754 RepID=UPI002635D597|nr:globin domain-containing protein [uncultured Sphingomonas sp.]